MCGQCGTNWQAVPLGLQPWTVDLPTLLTLMYQIAEGLSKICAECS